MYRVFHTSKLRLALGAVLLSFAFFALNRADVPTAVAANAAPSPGTVYLTFDDGPSENTPHLMEVLEKHHVKASFFVMAFDEEEKPLLQRLASRGHTVSPHTWRHDYNAIYQSFPAFQEDFTQICQALREIPGTNCSIYRFPGGSVNRYAPRNVLNQAVALLDGQNVTYFDWDIVSGDDTAVVYPAETLAQNVLENIEQYENPIILFHDASLCTTTADAVDLLIPQLKRRGYRFAPLSSQTPSCQFYTRRYQ